MIMKCKKKLNHIFIIIFLLFLTTIEVHGQGIKFEEWLTWSQVLEKAKQENKYIFVDCFTTWCGPCKAMDRNVYPIEKVGEFFNSKFISVKMQMDKSKSDDSAVKRRYADAQLLEKKFKIFSYPTYLFFSPEGVLVNKDFGLKQPADFIAVGEKALTTDKNYIDPFEEYNHLMADYRSGKKDYTKMLYMINQSQKAMEWEIGEKLTSDYYQYLQSQPKNKLYTKENLTFIASNIQSSQDTFFHLFFINDQKINKILSNSLFVASALDPVIIREEADPLLGSEGSAVNVIPGVVPVAIEEPDWNKLYKIIKTKYNKEYASRNVLNAKIKWYGNYQWWLQWIASSTEKINKFGVDTANELEDVMLGEVAWKIFLQSDDVNQLESAIKWMDGVCTRSRIVPMYPVWDTYANLLHKIGKTQEALTLEEKALEYAKENNDKENIKLFAVIIRTMRANKPTWINYDSLSSKPLVIL